jgi:hypothetical protein
MNKIIATLFLFLLLESGNSQISMDLHYGAQVSNAIGSRMGFGINKNLTSKSSFGLKFMNSFEQSSSGTTLKQVGTYFIGWNNYFEGVPTLEISPPINYFEIVSLGAGYIPINEFVEKRTTINQLLPYYKYTVGNNDLKLGLAVYTGISHIRDQYLVSVLSDFPANNPDLISVPDKQLITLVFSNSQAGYFFTGGLGVDLSKKVNDRMSLGIEIDFMKYFNFYSEQINFGLQMSYQIN